jgi:hypothetical protein
MMKRWSLPLAVILLASQTACYTTKVVTNLEPDSRAYARTDRQWFALGGLVPLSEPPGRECTYGLSSAQSEMNGVDLLINVGLVTGSILVGTALCSGDDATRLSCASSVSLLVPFLLGTRTVEYYCAAPPRAPAARPVPVAPTATQPPPPAPQIEPLPPPPNTLSEPPPPPPSP